MPHPEEVVPWLEAGLVRGAEAGLVRSVERMVKRLMMIRPRCCRPGRRTFPSNTVVLWVYQHGLPPVPGTAAGKISPCVTMIAEIL